MQRTFVMGDIHGAYRALKQCLERAEFDYENDALICLGDVCDGWPETKKCIDELLHVKKLTYILGNHDLWLLAWMQGGEIDPVWAGQGGKATVESYKEGIPPAHIQFLKNAVPYLVQDQKLFVHAGINTLKPIAGQGNDTFLWDRTLAHQALEFYAKGIKKKITKYKEVYLGHTPIPYNKPLHSCEIWLMDTGAGWAGVLSIMEINSKEIFTSDATPSLYPGLVGRTKRSVKQQ